MPLELTAGGFLRIRGDRARSYQKNQVLIQLRAGIIALQGF